MNRMYPPPAKPNKTPRKLPPPNTAKPQARSNTNPNANSYVPTYTPPPEPPAPPPAPNVENHIEIPGTMEVDATSMSDLENRIIANASVLYPGEPLKLATAVAPSGMVCHALLVAPKNEKSPTSRYKVVMRGPGVPGDKNRPAEGRWQAIAGMLEEVERRVGRELLAS